ncbi:MAG: SDR family oxidoreductase [Chloroherpetonaceae bacterium]|nr:SDR family oxidoreductase [Chloroherpetonaceae bacterium]MDW8437606.1 SDR family oxidoreductase [Chloroherpetonaceae bacterium]
MKILLTGASGLLGGNCLARFSANKSVQLFATHRDPAFIAPDKFSNGQKTFALDLTDETSVWNVVSTIQPNVIVHAAAHADTSFCEWNRAAAKALNLDATKTLATLAEMFGARFIFISTDLVFDGTKGDYDETDSPNPISYYGETKAEAESLVRKLVGNHVILRAPLLLGVSPRGNRSANEKLTKELLAGRRVKLFFDEYRTPISADALAKIIEEFAIGTLSEITGLFHAGGREKLSREELGRKIARRFKLDEGLIEAVALESVASSPPRPRDVSLNSAKLHSLLPHSLPTIDESLNALPE